MDSFLLTKALRRRAFTLIEVLVVVAIIALLVAILLPSLARARAQAKMVVCLSNLKQLGTGAVQYANEHHDYIPPPLNFLERTGDTIVRDGRRDNEDIGPQPNNGYYVLGDDDMRVYYPKYGADLNAWVCPGAANVVENVGHLRGSYSNDLRRRGQAYEYIPFLYNVIYRPQETLIYQVSRVNPAIQPLRLVEVKRAYDISITHDADDPGENWQIINQEDPHPMLKGGNMQFADGHARFIKAGKRSVNWIKWSDKGRPLVAR